MTSSEQKRSRSRSSIQMTQKQGLRGRRIPAPFFMIPADRRLEPLKPLLQKRHITREFLQIASPTPLREIR
jgi:hypothetical protein